MISEIQIFHNKSINELSDDIKLRSIQSLSWVLSAETVYEIRQAHQENPDTWWATSHFTWGMSIRNFLRDNVCTDENLPSGNWDDYYIPLVELACGIGKV